MRLRSPHFAVHHLAGRPLPLRRPPAGPPGGSGVVASAAADTGEGGHAPVTASLSTELSTGGSGAGESDVDDLHVQCPESLVETPTCAGGIDRWLGLVVPKRHARRAVTRTLMKRQIRHIAAACAAQLEPGLWVVRQRHPFDAKQFPSAASDALKEAARAELRALFERAMRGERDRLKPRPPGASDARSGKGSKARPAPAGSAQGPSCAP
ncbi:MAG: ribonuclease P protein component [Burkholderiales bacterium]|nr:ribonuclease P protein component [Burkholderiales bacterium]